MFDLDFSCHPCGQFIRGVHNASRSRCGCVPRANVIFLWATILHSCLFGEVYSVLPSRLLSMYFGSYSIFYESLIYQMEFAPIDDLSPNALHCNRWQIQKLNHNTCILHSFVFSSDFFFSYPRPEKRHGKMFHPAHVFLEGIKAVF